MEMIREIKWLILKEFLLEWKQKYAFNGLLLYVLCMVVVLSLAFNDGVVISDSTMTINILTISTHSWNILYWIIMLFVAINAVAKSFAGEQDAELMYLYTLSSPISIVLAKMLYNSLVLCVIGLVTVLSYASLAGTDIQSMGLFLSGTLLGACAFAANLTLVSAIAAKAENQGTLLAVLAFPLIVPVLLNLIEITRKAIEGFGFADVMNTWLMTAGITLVLAVLSVILFPFVWRD